MTPDVVDTTYLERTEGDGFLVEVVPRAAQFSSLIPDFLHVGVVLYDDGVLYVAATGRWSSVATTAVVGRRGHATTIQEDLEGSTQVPRARLQVYTVWIAVETWTEIKSTLRKVCVK